MQVKITKDIVAPQQNSLKLAGIPDATLASVNNVDWSAAPIKQHIVVGPFSIDLEADLADPIENSYFSITVTVNIPFLGEKTIINGRLDKTHTKLDASLFGVGATVEVDFSAREVSADLHAFGYNYHVKLFNF